MKNINESFFASAKNFVTRAFTLKLNKILLD